MNELHAVFDREPFDDDWVAMTDRHSVGWVTARRSGRLVGFLDVVTDGQVHAWLQDVMVSPTSRRQGVGRDLVRAAEMGARQAGCERLHDDFDAELSSFYLDACGFTPAHAGLKRL